MKKYVFILCFVLSALSAFSVPLTGFWGIPWGASLSDVQQKMSERGYVSDVVTKIAVGYKNVNFAGRNCSIDFFIKDSYFYLGVVTIITKENNSYEEYQSLKSDLIEKYGQPRNNNEKYKYPYEKGDGHFETALRVNCVDISASWFFEENNAVIIKLKYNDKKRQVELSLAYMQGKMILSQSEEKKKSTLDDL